MKFSIDNTNIMLMLISCALAFTLPFELVLLSYAFLGPAHYLTQISWMHDRDYFVGKRWFWVPGSAITLLLLITIYLLKINTPLVSYGFYSFAIAIAMGFSISREKHKIILITSAVMAALLILHVVSIEFSQGLIILLPTVIHVYIFTGAFILLGALKSNNKSGLVSFVVFMACSAMFLIVTPPDIMTMPNFVTGNIFVFAGVADYLAEMLSFGGLVEGHAMLGFLSFVYTYHYLNWFSKADIIKWHQIPRQRLAAIAFLYIISISLYLYDYSVGLLALLFLSILHVILEFPLNIITFRTLGGMALSTVKMRA